MFKRQYILSFVRNLLIFSLLAPFLVHYLITLGYRIPNADKEKLLRYIDETADLSYLSTPAGEYGYFYAWLDTDGNTVHVSGSEGDAIPVGSAMQAYLDSIRRIYYQGISYASRFNVTPEDEAYNHREFEDFFFSSLLVAGGAGEHDLLHVIYRRENLTFWALTLYGARATLFCILISSPLCLLFAYLELRPTKKAWIHQKRFIAQTSHELRTPITVITTAMDHYDAEDTERLIKQELRIMTGIVNDMMFLSRVDAKQLQLRKSPLELSSVLLECYLAIQVLAEDKLIQFEEFHSDQVVLRADESLIRQMVGVLLKNAVDYTEPGGKVGLSARVTGAKVEITVTDTGAGIAPKERRKIFKRFYRVNREHSSNQGNSGMGLAIASWIVKQHRGKIRVESKPGQGSRFVVTLPIVKPYGKGGT